MAQTSRGGPAEREPRPRQKSNGAWFVRWGGKDHYLSTNALEAQRLWLDPMSRHPGARVAWLRWRTARRHAVESADLTAGPPRLVVDVARELLEEYQAAGRAQAAHYFRTHLARFVNMHGEAQLLALAVPAPERGVYQAPIVRLLEAHKIDFSQPSAGGYSPRTINHDLTAIKRLFNFAADRGLCPTIHWRAVRRLPVPAPEPEELSPRVLFRVMRRIHRREPLLLPYLALNYLTLARPSEVVELVCSVHPPEHAKMPEGHHRRKPAARRDPSQRGRFMPVIDEQGRVVHPRGLFALRRHKNAWRPGDAGGGGGGGGGGPPPRLLVLTDQALAWLELAVPVWSTLDSYSAACSRALPGFGARMLRDSAASHLRSRGVGLEGVQILLGHVTRGEWPSYARTPWHVLRASASQIAL
jgi:integrase